MGQPEFEIPRQLYAQTHDPFHGDRGGSGGVFVLRKIVSEIRARLKEQVGMLQRAASERLKFRIPA
jgi:hypothetical protein